MLEQMNEDLMHAKRLGDCPGKINQLWWGLGRAKSMAGRMLVVEMLGLSDWISYYKMLITLKKGYGNA